MNDLDSYEYNEPGTDPADESPRDQGESRHQRWLVALVAVLAALAVVVVAWLWSRRSTEAPVPTSEEEAAAERPAPVTTEPVTDDDFELPSLDASDVVVREMAAALSAHPVFASWLVNEDLVRRFVVAVDNAAEGQSPRSHLGFITVEGAFRATEGDGPVAMDPAGFRRFDPLVEVFSSLDTEGTVELYRRLEPLMDEAYRELGYPQRRFEETLRKAAQVVLDTPRIEGVIELRPGVRSYHFADDQLEQLDPLQRQLLRFGPKNLTRLQEKVRSLLSVLDSGTSAE